MGRSSGLLNLIAFLRVSTDAQDVARQRTDIEKLKKKFPTIRILRIVELIGVSGTDTLKNEHVQKILAELKKEEVDGIAISALDRLFRPGKRWAQWAILDYFADENKSIWSQREGFIDPNTEEGYEKCLAAGGRAGAEWRILKQRTHDGKVEKAMEGFLPHGNARYGYNIIGRKHTGIIGKGRAVINEKEAPVVSEAFRWADCGMATYEIASRLNQEGILSKGHNGEDPKPWSCTTILQMLHCTDYIGQHHWKGITIPVPRIVSDELFYRVQAKMAGRKEQSVGRRSTLFLLRSKLFCGRCGHRMLGKGNKGQRRNARIYYLCGHRTNKPPLKRRCDAPMIWAKVIESVAWNAIWGMLKNPALLLAMGKAIYADHLKPDAEKVTRIERRIAQLEKRDRNLMQMQEDASTPEEYQKCRERRNTIRWELASLEVELRDARKVVVLPSLSALEQRLETITTGAEPTTYEERRPILEELVDLRMEYADGNLRIEGKVPLDEPSDLTGDGENHYRAVRADAQRERERGHGGEERIDGHRPQAVADVLRELFPKGPCPHGAAFLLK
jgi:DNA invertase Pin-like site-specific DNA recombinase